jgi:hypothetical protein
MQIIVSAQMDTCEAQPAAFPLHARFFGRADIPTPRRTINDLVLQKFHEKSILPFSETLREVLLSSVQSAAG